MSKALPLHKPKSILWFGRLYFASLAIAALDAFLLWDQHIADFETEPELEGVGYLYYAIIWSQAFIFSIVIWYFIVMKPKLWAKWVQIILVALSIAILIGELFFVLFPVGDDGIPEWANLENLFWPYYLSYLYLIGSLVSVFATYMLFRSTAVDWFDTKIQYIDGVFD